MRDVKCPTLVSSQRKNFRFDCMKMTGNTHVISLSSTSAFRTEYDVIKFTEGLI